MNIKTILLILAVILFGLTRLLFHFYSLGAEDYKNFLLNLIIELIGIVIVILVVDLILSIGRKSKWKKINKPHSDSFKLRIQQGILTTLYQFRYVDFYKSKVQDLPKMKSLLERFLKEDFDRFISEKIDKPNKENMEFLINLMNWLANFFSGIIKKLRDAKPEANPIIKERIIFFNNFLWYTAKSLQTTGKIIIPNLDNKINFSETQIQPDLKIEFQGEPNPKEFKKIIKESLNYIIVLHGLAEKNKLFYITG